MTTKTITIYGTALEVRAPFAAGHVMTEAEAKALNQTRAENISNNVRQLFKDAGEDQAKLAEALEKAKAYDAEYEFTLANVGTSRAVDPVEREARSIAKELISAKLAENGRSIRKVPEGQTEESWKAYIEEKIVEWAANEAILKEAKKRVDARKKSTAGLLNDLQLG